jgi:sec-independent protein translocase protein TatB
MDFISNFNGLELIFIVILAIILFGPEKIPEIAAKLGTWARSLKEFSSQFMNNLREEAGLDEITDEGASLSDSLRQTNTNLNQAVQSMQSPVNSLKNSLENQVLSTKSSTDQIKQVTKKTPPAPEQTTDRTQLQQRLLSLEQELQEIRSALANPEEEIPKNDTDG